MMHNHVLDAVDEELALNAVRSSKLQFLDDLTGAAHDGLARYFPATSAGELSPGRGESLYNADGIAYLGRDDGSMVPIDDEHLEPMPENIWDAGKFSALVEAVEQGERPVVHPGYADLFIEGGELAAQVRDGHHRAFAPIAAGGRHSWVLMSDRTKQDLDERVPGSDAVYRAVRSAQRQFTSPQFKRRRTSKVNPSKRAALLQAEQRMLDIESRIENVHRKLLLKYGRASGGYDLEEQLRRPHVFWPIRHRALSVELRDEFWESPEKQELDSLRHASNELVGPLYDLRRAAGLAHGERLDPATGAVVR